MSSNSSTEVMSVFLSANPLVPSSTTRKPSASAAPKESLFLFLKSSQTFRTLASRVGASGVDLAAAFSCAVATAVSHNEHAIAITIIFIFLLLNLFSAPQRSQVKIPTLRQAQGRLCR